MEYVHMLIAAGFGFIVGAVYGAWANRGPGGVMAALRALVKPLGGPAPRPPV